MDAGAAILVGQNEDRIVAEARKLIHSEESYQRMAEVKNPYGDGEAAQRILAALQDRLGR